MLEWSAPRGMLFWAIPGLVLSVGAFVLAMVTPTYGAWTLGAVGILGFVSYLRVAMLAARGKVEVSRNGYHNTLALRATSGVEFKAISAFELVPTPFGMKVRAKSHRGSAKEPLAAPRSALLGRQDVEARIAELNAWIPGGPRPVVRQRGNPLVVWTAMMLGLLLFLQLFDQPWNLPVFQSEAARVPDACAVLDGRTARSVLPTVSTEPVEHTVDRDSSFCRMQAPGGAGAVQLGFQRFTHYRTASGGGRAKEQVEWMPGSRSPRIGEIRGERVNRYRETMSVNDLIDAEQARQNARYRNFWTIELSTRRGNVVMSAARVQGSGLLDEERATEERLRAVLEWAAASVELG